MLTKNDIDIMNNTVKEIINMWDMKLIILKPIPKDQQSNWNSLLNEYSGSIDYTKYINVIAERKDQQNMNVYNLDITTHAGDISGGALIFTFPSIYSFIDETCRILYNNEQWHIISIKDRIGERLVMIDRLNGNDEIWSEIPYKIINVSG